MPTCPAAHRLLPLLCALCLAPAAHAGTPFKHVIIVFQENRTPDNLFQGLLTWPGITHSNYDILPNGMSGTVCKSPQALYRSGATHPAIPSTGSCPPWLGGTTKKVCLEPRPIYGGYDPDHSHCGYVTMLGQGKMDSASYLRDVCHGDAECTKLAGAEPNALNYKYAENDSYVASDGKTYHRLDPYLQLAANYGWANRMFQSNKGPSFPAHQFIFGGTSAQDGGYDSKGMFISENPGGVLNPLVGYTGCLGASGYTSDAGVFIDGGVSNWRIQPPGTSCPPGCNCFSDGTECRVYQGATHELCFNHGTMGSLLDAHKPNPLSWKFYSPAAGSIWTAPLSIQNICVPDYSHKGADGGSDPICTGADWANNVDLNLNDVVGDIKSCKLSNVTWVIPDGRCSDHAFVDQGGGPAWVASIVDAVGKSTCADGNWNDTAIIVTWDDWGGWYDHVKPPTAKMPWGDYQYGFRVPLLVVSAQTKPGSVSNTELDFGSILRFVEGNFGLGVGALGFADARAQHGIDETPTGATGVFFNQAPQPYMPLKNLPPVPSFCTPALGSGQPPDFDSDD
jgi:phospholipase C